MSTQANAQNKYDHPSTWSIVAADPTTGDVGVAGASCVGVPIDALASLVPGVGVAATQAWFEMGNRDAVHQLLQTGVSADAVIGAVTAADGNRETRQYGVITLGGGSAKIAAFTGAENGDWAGDRQSDVIFPVTVQGNILTEEAVVNAALDAFNNPDLGDVALSDRLLRALEAGSAAGGDKRCNENGVEQTAAAAFIVMARGGDAPFAVQTFGGVATETDNPPFLALSVSEPILGQNPLPELRRQYDEWRSANLPPCPDCDLSAIPVPPGSADGPPTRPITSLASIAIGILLSTLVALGIWRRRSA